MSEIEAGFVFPIINNKLFLAKRATNPNKGMWGAIGGKLDDEHKNSQLSQHFKRKALHLNGLFHIHDRELEDREPTLAGALRECYEELFAGGDPTKLDLDDMKNKFSHPLYIGNFSDNYNGQEVKMHFYVVIINTNIEELNISKRELYELKEMSQINFKKIWPISQLALFQYYQFLRNSFGIPDSSNNLNHYLKNKDLLLNNMPEIDENQIADFSPIQNRNMMINLLYHKRHKDKNWAKDFF